MVDDLRTCENQPAASSREAADQYRRDDEIEIGTANHRRICENLARISSSFARKIHVLDVGCGTGRHFHCLKNVELLVGVDISAEMLRAAEKPVKSEEISAESIRLLQRNIYEHTFPAGMFDFIYSSGVFGHGASFTAELGRKFHHWLEEGGRLYFNTIETSEDPRLIAGRRKIKRAVYPLLPQSIQRKLDERSARPPGFAMTREELDAVMRASGFADFSISAHICRAALGSGVHLECVATKSRRRTCVAQVRGSKAPTPPDPIS